MANNNEQKRPAPMPQPIAPNAEADTAKAAAVDAVAEKAASDQAQKSLAQMNQPTPGYLTGEQYAEKKGEPTVAMNFTRRLVVQVEGGTKVEFHKGRQNVPKSLVDHFYVKASGAKEA